MQEEFKVVVLISGRGSNLEALLKNQQNYRITAVISDNSQAAGLKLAPEAAVQLVESFPREDYASKLQQKNAIYSRIRSLQPDLICLAGFMQIIESDFINEYYGKIVNIHPSLLPKLVGLDTHRRALEDNLNEHGCTVHYVDSGLDSGPVITQAGCNVLKSDTEELLAARVLVLEHKLYPWVVNAIAANKIRLERSGQETRGEVRIAAEALADAKQYGFLI